MALRGGWFHTGDMGYVDQDGFFYISGRSKDMIISGGENIYPTEIGDVVSAHPAVSQVAFIGVLSAKCGEAVHAVVIPAEGGDLAADDLVAHCREHPAGCKSPRGITFRREPTHLSPANKILKSELRRQVLEQSALE